MALILGQFNRGISSSTRKLEILAMITPVFAEANKYSSPFITIISF
jgi:hypothetical protein